MGTGVEIGAPLPATEEVHRPSGCVSCGSLHAEYDPATAVKECLSCGLKVALPHALPPGAECLYCGKVHGPRGTSCRPPSLKTSAMTRIVPEGPCGDCDGAGYGPEGGRCKSCRGSGDVFTVLKHCPDCLGIGKLPWEDLVGTVECDDCCGTGWVDLG